MTASQWTALADVVETLRARWQRGHYLKRYAMGEPWEPIRVALRGPSGEDILRDHGRVERWATSFDKAEPFTVEWRPRQTKTLGRNEIPARLRLETFDDLVALLGVGDEVKALDAVLAETEHRAPALTGWVATHPVHAVAHAGVWSRLIDVVLWIDAVGAPSYVRHIDIPGVDTKFVEAHEKLLGRLLPLVLAPERVTAGEPSFARRFGLLDKPRFTRLRLFGDTGVFPAAITDISVRTDELAQVEIPVRTVFVIENEVTFLAFPPVADALVVFGGGFGVTSLEQLPWLAARRLVYWGDIDTHGFAILDRLRRRFPHTESMLMDSDTLISHAEHLSVEANPTSAQLANLSRDEASVYADLVEGRHGRGARLEQERVRFSAVAQALQLTH